MFTPLIVSKKSKCSPVCEWLNRNCMYYEYSRSICSDVKIYPRYAVKQKMQVTK